MIKPIAIAIIGLCAATTMSFAQSASGPKSAADCQQIWTTADASKDGMLDKTELEANKARMPSSLMTGSITTPDGSTTGFYRQHELGQFQHHHDRNRRFDERLRYGYDGISTGLYDRLHHRPVTLLKHALLTGGARF